MSRVSRQPTFRLWEHAWFLIVTGVLLAAGFLTGLIGLVARMIGARRK